VLDLDIGEIGANQNPDKPVLKTENCNDQNPDKPVLKKENCNDHLQPNVTHPKPKPTRKMPSQPKKSM